MANASDRELVDKARNGDADAFGVLVRRHQKRIYQLAAHLTKSAAEAEDVVQETFVRAYQALERFDGRSEPFTWLYRIAVNLCLNHLRTVKAHRKTRALDDDPRIEALVAESRPGRGDAAMVAHRRRLAEALASGVDTLSDTLRTTLILVCIDGVSHDDAAEILGSTAGTIAWRVHEARRKLKLYLEERGFGGDLE